MNPSPGTSPPGAGDALAALAAADQAGPSPQQSPPDGGRVAILSALYRGVAGRDPGPARRAAGIAICFAATAFCAVGVVGIAAITLVVAGRIARLTLTHSSLGDAHHWIPVAVAWIVVVSFATAMILMARATAPQLRRWLAPEPQNAWWAPDTERARSVARPASWRPVLAAAGETSLYLAVALVLVWPATFQLDRAIVGYGDSPYYVWLGWKVADLIRHGHLPLVIPDVTWPYGANLLASDGYLSTLVIGLWNLVASPILAFNLAVLTAILANCYAARHLARQLSSHRIVWIVTAIAFATAPCIARPIRSQFNLVFLFPVALIAAEAVAVALHGHRIRWIRLGVLGFVAYLCSIYVLIFSAIGFAAALAFAGVFTQRRWWQPLGRVAAAGLITAVLMSPFIATHLLLERDEAAHGAPRLTATNDTYRDSSDVVSVLGTPLQATIPLRPIYRITGNTPSDLTIGAPPYSDGLTLAVEPVLLPGYPMLLAFGLMLLIRHPLARAVAGAAAVCWVLSLGPTLQVLGQPLLRATPVSPPVDWLPYGFLGQIPGLGALRAPSRATFALAGLLAVAVAVAVAWLRRVIARSESRGTRIGLALITGVFVTALVATNLTIPNRTSTFPISPATGARIAAAMQTADGSNDSVVDVPADCTPAGWDNSILLQYYYRRPTVGCQQDVASIPWYSGLDLYASSTGLAALRCSPQRLGVRPVDFPAVVPLTEADLDAMKAALRVRYALVDKRYVDGCSHLRTTAMPLITRHRLVAGDAQWALYDLDR